MNFVFSSRHKILAVIVFVLACFISCTKPSEREAAQLASDAAATSELNRINAVLASPQPPSREDVSVLMKLREQYPNSPVVRQLLQGVLIKRNDWEPVTRLISSVPAAERGFNDNLNLAKALIKQGRYAEAEQVLGSLNPGPEHRIETSALLGQSQFYRGDLDRAAATLEPIQADLLAARRAEELALLGTIYFRRGDHARAIDVLGKTVAAVPDSISANSVLSRVYAAAGDSANAELYRAKLDEINSKIAADEKRKSRLVPLFYELEDAYKAREFDKVIDLANRVKSEADARSLPAVYQYLAAAYAAKGNNAEASRARDEAARLTQK